MSLPFYQQNDSSDQYQDNNQKFQLRHVPYTGKYKSGDQSLFDSNNISAHTETYDIVKPSADTGDIFLQMQNPALLAFRNKSTGTKLINNSKPTLASPVNKQRGNSKSSLSNKPNQISLLQRRPLTSLKNPEIHSIDIVKRQIEQEKMTINFKEDPIAYFSKHKDGRGHRFIYLVYKDDPHSPYFSPYDLEKVSFAEIRGEYFTMSATGVTHVYTDGTTETISLDLWATEKSIFNSIRKLKIFTHFFFWKPFRLWKNFVMHERYNELDSNILQHPFYTNKEFFSSALFLFDRQTKSKELLKKFLLAFQSQRKYRLEEFVMTNKTNIDHLKLKYEKFINKTQHEVLTLYTTISNPKLVSVHDSDFPDIKHRNPNLAQLMVLEKRKAQKRMEKTEAINKQIIEIGGYIRMIDYMLLETLSQGCIEAWKNAESNVASEQSSVFVVDVLFDEEGKVTFKPTLDVLLESITSILNESIKTLNMLPRLLMQIQMRPFLRDNGLDYMLLFDQGPQFQMIIDKEILEKVRVHIKEVVTASFREGFEISQSFSNFYPIYRLGQHWNVKDYLITPDNKKFKGQLNEDIDSIADEFLLKPNEQPIIDFQRVSTDINKYRDDKKRIENMRNGAVRGALFLDSKNLKSILAPIPQKALTELQELLTNLAQIKSDKLRNALIFYSRKLKQEPQTLDEYVEFCEILERCTKTTDQINIEIQFIDKMYELFDRFGFTHDENSNHHLLKIFQMDKTSAQTTREEHLGIFTEAIKMSIEEVHSKINKYYQKATSIPSTIKETVIETCIPSSEKLVSKIEKIKPRVSEVIRQQKVMGLSLNEFQEYEKVKSAAEFSVKLYKAIEQYQNLNDLITKIPFKSVHMIKFRNDVLDSQKTAAKLKEDVPNDYPILVELITRIESVAPYLDQMDQLAKGKMQERHWKILFERCNHKNEYNEEVTIGDLLKFGILQNKEQIDEITATSQGESELECEFLDISNYWNKVQMPLAETQIKSEETLLLGNTESLLIEIQNALITLSRMLALPYVQGIRENVLKLSYNLENVSSIIEAWKLFQRNWIVLSSLFSISEARNLLNTQYSSYMGVHKKWIIIARHTLKDTRLFTSCSYPNLLEVFKENNSTMELIIASLGKYLDAKRQQSPRLFFLGNSEVLTLITTKDHTKINSILSKIFMNVQKLDFHENEEVDVQRLKVYGLIGEDGDSIQFQRFVSFTSSMEQFITQIIDSMKVAVKESISSAISSCQSGSFIDWIMTTPTYIAYIALNTVFCNEIEDCFSTFESNPRAFQQYETTLKRRIEDLTDSFLLPLSKQEENKLTLVLTALLSFRDRFKACTETIQNYSPYLNWLNSIRFRYLPTSTSIQVEFADCKWEHGYEYWGQLVNLVHTPTIDSAFYSCVYSLTQNQLPILTSSAGSSKKLIGLTTACLFGQFAYISRPFPDLTDYFISKILTGVVSTGSFCIFNGIEQLSHPTLCYLFDNVYQILTSTKSTINSKNAELNKNCKFIFTSDSNFMSYGNIPPQLKSFGRPISLLEPNYSKIIESYLTSFGFRETKLLSPKLTSFFNLIPILSQIKLSFISRIFVICDHANQLVRNKTLNVPEQLALCFTSYKLFITLVKDQSSFLSTLFNSFQIGGGVEDMMDKINQLDKQIVEDTLRSTIEKEISSLELGLYTNYLTNQVLNLYHMMKQYHLIVICGPPNSGKSTILEILKRTFNREEINETEYKLTTLYQLSDSKKRMFGYVYDDGNMYAYGKIQSAIFNLIDSDKNHILKFDGHLTAEFSAFLAELFGHKSIMLNSLDTFPKSKSFHVIVETDDLSNATPAFLAKAGIVLLDNLQKTDQKVNYKPPCELLHPSIPFSRALKQSFDCINPTQIEVIRNVFNEIAPLIVQRIYHSKNLVYSTEKSLSIKLIQNANVLICDILPMYAAILAMRTIDSSEIDLNDEEQVRKCMIMSFASIYNQVLLNEDKSSFNTWLCIQFKIQLPKDWIGFTVSSAFTECFPHPSLINMRINKNQFIPLNQSKLEKKPIFTHFLLDKNDSDLPLFTDEISIIHPQVLPQLNLAESLLMSRQNILIHGPFDSGKTSFLPMIFTELTNVEAIPIDVSKYYTIDLIVHFLCTNTSIISKSSPNQHKNFVLIFDGITSDHSELIEFIRMIIETHKIPKYSPNDQKFFEFDELLGFSVIVTTRNYNELPLRFLAHFAPISLMSITDSSSQFIGSKILQTYGFTQTLSTQLMNVATLILAEFQANSVIYCLCNICSSLCFLDKDNMNNTPTVVSLLFGELFYSCLHSLPVSDFKEKVLSIFQDEFKEQSKCLQNYFGIDYAQYPSFTVENHSIVITIKSSQFKTLREELDYFLSIYNSNSIEKLSIKFSNATIKSWLLIYRTLTRPGANAILYGNEGSGRYTLCRFVASMIESEFVTLTDIDDLETCFDFLKNIITNAVVNEKKSVIYIKANSTNKNILILLIDFISKFVFEPFFSEEELIELFEKVLEYKPTTVLQREQAKLLIVDRIRFNVHALINTSNSLDYKLDYNRFTSIYFNPPEDYDSEVLMTLNNNQMKDLVSNTTDREITILKLILPKIQSIATKYSRYITLNNFYDFLECFSKYSNKEFNSIKEKKTTFEKVLEFLKKLKEENEQLKNRLNSLSPNLDRLRVDSDSLQQSYNTRKEAIETRAEKIEQEHMDRQNDIELIEKELKEITEKRDEMEPTVKQAKSEVEKLTDNDIKTIRITASDPKPSLRLLLESICVLLELPPSYEKNGQKLLMGSQFLPTLLSRINITPQLIKEVEPYFTDKNLNASDLESIAPALSTLYKWIIAEYNLAVLNADLAKKKNEFEFKQKEFNDYETEMNLELASIEQVGKTLEGEKIALEQSNQARLEMEEEYQTIDKRKSSIDSIFQGLDVATNKWENDYHDFNRNCSQILGDMIMFSFYISYCGSMTSKERNSSLDEVVDLLKTSGIKFTFSDYKSLLKKHFDVEVPHDVSHISFVCRTPLVIDPDTFLLNEFNNHFVISQSLSTLEQVLQNCITAGKTLVLTDCDYLHPLVNSVLPLITMNPDDSISKNIKVGTKLVEWNPQFRLILTTSSPIGQIPADLLARVALIDSSDLSLQLILEKIEETFMGFFAADLLSKNKDIDQDSTKVEIKLLQKFFEIQSKEGIDYLDNVDDLIKMKDEYLNALKTQTDDLAAKQQYKALFEEFRQHIELCQTFWKVMSRDLPIINASCIYSYTNYIAQIKSVITNSGLHPGTISTEQHQTLHQSLINSTFPFVFNSIPINDSLFFLFMSTFTVNNKHIFDANQPIKNELIKQIVNKSIEKAEFDLSVSANTNLMENIKQCNVSKLFDAMLKFISEKYGNDYQSYLPYFQFDAIITNSSSIPTIVISDGMNNPAALIQHFVSLRLRNENLNIISLYDDVELIKNARKIILTSQNRGNWVILHYSKPSMNIASMLTDVFNQMTTATINTNFRLIIICSSIQYLSKLLIQKSKRITVESFPCMRHDLLSILQHYSSSIRSTTNSRAMKKLSYTSSLLLTLLKFRSFITPIGFSSNFHFNDLVFKDIIEQLRIIIDAHPNDPPLRNLRLQFERIVCAGVNEIHDRKIIQAHSNQLLKVGTLDDGFSIVSKTSKEKGIWTIPDDIPLSNFGQIISQIPIFTSTDVLHMNSNSLLNWNLSIWLINSFKKYLPRDESIDFNKAMTKIDNFLMLLPEKLSISKTVANSFLMEEIDQLNMIIDYLSSQLSIFTHELMKRINSKSCWEFSQGKVPFEWKKVSNIWNFDTVNSFASHIIERHSQLMRCMKESNPVIFDLSLLENPSRLFKQFLLRAAIDEGQPVESYSYTFLIIEGKSVTNIKKNCLYLTHCFLANGDIEAGQLVLSKEKPFKKIDLIEARIASMSTKQPKTFPVPMFKNAISRLSTISPTIEHGETDNFVYTINLPTEVSEIEMQQNGTAFFCRLPEQFVL